MNSREYELYHHGILGQKWGIRRYQNPDGTLTAAGKSRYHENFENAKTNKKIAKKEYDKSFNKAYWYNRNHPLAAYGFNKEKSKHLDDLWGDAYDKAHALDSAKKSYKQAKKDLKDYEHTEKMDKYREKLSEKAEKKASKFREMEKKDRDEYDDLKKNGTNSQVYKDKLAEVQRERELDYIRRNSVDANGMYKDPGNYRTSLDYVLYSLNDRAMGDMNVKTMLIARGLSADENKALAERFEAKHEALMNMPVDNLTSKRDIKSVYRRG